VAKTLQQEARAARARSTGKVVALFKQLDVDVFTRWRKAHDLVLTSDQWESDAELRKLPTLDVLLAFEDYSRVREREFDEQMRRAQVEKTRKERKAREGFKVCSIYCRWQVNKG
jgi:pre-mRNA-processing factor 40